MTLKNPIIIQGGMGIGISNWRLASAVSKAGHLGVVSGTALNSLFVRQLQRGDPDGVLVDAMAHFSVQEMVSPIFLCCFVPGCIKENSPFKVFSLDETLSEESIYQARKRKCELGYLRQPYRKADGRLGYRCPSEDVSAFVKKGGQASETVGRKCLCNALLANAGYGQNQEDGSTELPLVTLGSDIHSLTSLFKRNKGKLNVVNVIDFLMLNN